MGQFIWGWGINDNQRQFGKEKLYFDVPQSNFCSKFQDSTVILSFSIWIHFHLWLSILDFGKEFQRFYVFQAFLSRFPAAKKALIKLVKQSLLSKGSLIPHEEYQELRKIVEEDFDEKLKQIYDFNFFARVSIYVAYRAFGTVQEGSCLIDWVL